MKHNKLFIIAFAAAAFISQACTSDFLTVENPTAQYIQDYFTTKDHLDEAVGAAYKMLNMQDWNGGDTGVAGGAYTPLFYCSDIMADQIGAGGADKADAGVFYYMMNYEATADQVMMGLWSVAYSGVKRCNDVLEYITWTKDISSDEAKAYEAEIKVLRALYYSWVWKFWGNIPYYEQNLTGDFSCPQYKADEVYEKVITDLQAAIDLGTLPMKESDERLGHVTLATAYMLYAEMAMYQNDDARMQTALGYMKAIISDGSYDLNPKFADIWTEEGEWCDESIFEINYASIYRAWGGGIWNEGGTIYPCFIGPKGYSGDDGRGNFEGYGFGPVYAETAAIFEDGDTRKDATIWDAASHGSYTARYQDSGLFLEKYSPRESNFADKIGGDNQLNFNNNLRVYRFAETLLNAAELGLKFGDANAAEYLNRVHSRAIPGETVSLTLDNIKEEREREFVGEGRRYWDLIRWGDAASVLKPRGERTNSWSESKKYLPIPRKEMAAAAGTENPLTQNEY